ncbi:MAG: molybdopterin-dependent oxidoreductase, partial [Gammaproteobacteria bacterium]|jgi:NADH-quinone oxidoreductase subunit G
MLEQPLAAYLLCGLEPEWDSAGGERAIETLRQSDFVVMLTPFVTATMQSYASVLLPCGTFAETAGTFINGEGRWQTFGGVARPLGESRPAWKILRVLGNLLAVEGMEYPDVAAVRQELESHVPKPGVEKTYRPQPDRAYPLGPVPGADYQTIYGVDPVVRRAPALQATDQGRGGWRRKFA